MSETSAEGETVTDEDVSELSEDLQNAPKRTTKQEALEEELIEEEPSIYDANDFISGPIIQEGSTVPDNILEFDFSYGYDCKKYYNLAVMDETTAVFASGNYLHFFNIVTKEISFRRSALGGGIGHIKKNPTYAHLAVAESGEEPIIIIYEWPELTINCVLKGGSSKIYTNMDYSPNGEYLVSQGGEPDYLITVWNWTKHRILLRTKSYVNDVHRVKFSPYVPGELSTAGVAHIKFWKMAQTFTGLKLKGELGRFGKTEYSDILGVLPMPDEKVVSGCSWGNILIWEEGLIKLEVYRSQRKKCHEEPIVQFFFNEGELWSVSMDGHVKIWWYEQIDQADPPEDDRVFLTDPTYDFFTPGIMLMYVERCISTPPTSFYLAQDGNGGIWNIDLNTEEQLKASRLLYKCHGGKVMDIEACPFNHYLASLGEDGQLILYDYVGQKLVFHHKFPAKGVKLIWLPLEIQATGDGIICAFGDGQVRVCLLAIDSDEDITLKVIQIVKPHSKPVTAMSMNSSGSILVTGGEDSTIFVFQMDNLITDYVQLKPIGYFPTPDVVSCISWHLTDDAVVILGGFHGHLTQIPLPRVPQYYTDVSYLLKVVPSYNKFTTYKSQIRRNIKLSEIEKRKAAKMEEKRDILEKIRAENPGLDIDEDIFLADSESEEVLEPLYIPEEPNKIFWLKYTEDETIWLSMAGFDAGYIYEYTMSQSDELPIRYQMVHDADDTEISSYVYSKDKQYLILGMQNGSIRVNKVKEDFRDLSDYWLFPMHDNINSFIPKMCFSADNQYFFSCGYDGNVFAYKFNPEQPLPNHMPIALPRLRFPEAVSDEDAHAELSLEGRKMHAEDERIMKLANEHKAALRAKIESLRSRYANVLSRNKSLPTSQMIPLEELIVDPRINEYIDKLFADNLDLVRRKLEYDVERSKVKMLKLKEYAVDPLDIFPLCIKGINSDVHIFSVRQRVMDPTFYKMKEIIKEKLLEEDLKGRPIERPQIIPKATVTRSPRVGQMEYFLMNLSPSVLEAGLGSKLSRLLQKYRARRTKWDKRTEEWDLFMATKIATGVNHPEDVKAFKEAQETIGDYKLKSSEDGRVPEHLRVSTVKKYNEVLEIRQKQFDLRHNFCAKIHDLRTRKVELLDYLRNQENNLRLIHEELPPELRKYGPPVPALQDEEFPEKNLEINVTISDDEISSLSSNEIEGPFTVKVITMDQFEKELIPIKNTFPEIKDDYFVCPINAEKSKMCSEYDIEKLFAISEGDEEEKETSFETHYRTLRLNRKNFEQTQIINSMKESIEDFNKYIEVLKDERIRLLGKGNFIDLYILTINHELSIMKNFEDGENALISEVQKKLTLLMDTQDAANVLKHDVDRLVQELEDSSLEEKRLQERFMQSAQDSKFFVFLRRVFRKKYKPPRERHDDEDSSEESSSSSDDSDEGNDAGSIDSRDFAIMRQDINVCPKGCDQSLFDLVVALRSKRHQIEQFVRDQTKVVESLQKQQELTNKKITFYGNQHKASQEELDSYQREKQRQLNQVRTTVVLYLNQIQNLTDAEAIFENVSDVLVFSKSTLSKLYKRIGILQHEKCLQEFKHDKYVKHIKRMKKDMMYMESKISELNKKIVTAMLHKFGQVVDVLEMERTILERQFKKSKANDMEEIMIKKMILELRLKISDIKQLYIHEINLWTKKCFDVQKELAETYKENSLRRDLLSILNKEKVEIQERVTGQMKKKINFSKLKYSHNELCEEVEKLEEVRSTQCKNMQELREEIKRLKTKGLAPVPIKPEEGEKEDGEREKGEEVVKDWVDYEDYYYYEREKEPEIKEEPEKEITDIFIATEAEDLVTDLLSDMFEELDKELDRKSKENLVKNIMSGILNVVSVTGIVNEIVENLPFKPSEDQIKVIEDTAEKLLALQEPELTEDDIVKCAEDLIAETIDEVMLAEGEVHEVMVHMVEKLLEALPVSLLTKEESVELMARKIVESLINFTLNKEKLAERVQSSASLHKEDVKEVLSLVLKKVYDTGIDYVFYIK